MTDPSEWPGDIFAESSRCLQNFDLFDQDMGKVDGDQNRRRVAVMMMMQEYIQLPQQSIRAYANRVKVNWRQAEWNLKKHDEVLYDIAWVGLRNTVMNKVGPMTAACGRFDCLDEFFDQTAASEVTHVEPEKPHQQQKQP
jgi:hypothetical protein